MANTAVKLGAAAIAIAIVLVAWRILGAEPQAGPTSEPSFTPTLVDEEPRDAPAGPRHALVDTSPAVELAEHREPAATTVKPPGETADEHAEAVQVTSTFSLRGRFVQPDHAVIQVESARVVLTGSRGLVREVAVAHASAVLVRDLEPDVYVARVAAPGFEHREQVLDLTQPERASREHFADSEAAFDERLVLWPDAWIAVVVITPDGRPFEEIADELQLERKRLLVDAFTVRTRFDPPDDEAWGLAAVPQPAVWRAPPLYQSWSLPGACVGSLQVLEPPPFWVGLAVHGVPLGWEVVSPGDREVVFRLDAQMLEDRLATVRMRVLDAPGGAPKGDVRVTLKADTSAHRRKDQANVQPDPDGRVALALIVPGRYELSVEGDGALHQELLELEPGEKCELGDIVLQANVAVPIHAVDAQGKPAVGWVEIAPYRRGERVRDLYPPNLHRSLDGNGEFRLPMPAEVSIVRVTLADPATGMQTNRLSQNVLLDPKRPPLGKLELVVLEPILVRFDAPQGEGARIEVLDELGLVVATPLSRDEEAAHAELAPGRYVARRVDGADRGLGETPFVVAGDLLRVTLP